MIFFGIGSDCCLKLLNDESMLIGLWHRRTFGHALALDTALILIANYCSAAGFVPQSLERELDPQGKCFALWCFGRRAVGQCLLSVSH